MQAPKSLLGRLGNPLNWSPGDKAFLVFIVTAVLHIEYAGWTQLVLANPDTARFMNVEVTTRVLPLSIGLALLSCILAGVMAFVRRIQPHAIWHEYNCNLYYALTLCVFSYMSGTLTMATGVVLAGAPVLGFILFRPAPVLWSLGAALAVQVIATTGSMLGWWPYAPAIAIPLGTDSQLSGFWFASMGLFVLPHLVILTFLSWYVLSGWRRREEAVRVLSLTDPLTGLANRRSILALLEHERDISLSRQRPLSVVMVDLDHFKQLNDTRGHAAGDAALKEVARRLTGVLRQSDHIGRFGGEEFLLVLPGADDEAAAVLAERCQRTLEKTPVVLDGGSTITVTASLGVFCNTASPELSSEAMLQRADQALYQAKEAGRNQVVTAGDTSTRPG